MKINWKEIDNYSDSTGTDFFTLSGDGDSAIVRIVAKNMDDVCIVPVHEQILVDNVERKVSCLRTPKGDIDECPFCKAGKRVSVKMYLELLVYEQDKYGELTGKVHYQIWERGKKYISKIAALCSRYASKKPLWDMLFEITRIGEKGDTSTTYEIFPITDTEMYNKCAIDIDSLPEPFEPVGTIVLDKNFEEMEYYVHKNKFPESESREQSDSHAKFGDDEDNQTTDANYTKEEHQTFEDEPRRRTRRIG